MTEQKCPNCGGRHGFEVARLAGCTQFIEVIQCVHCGVPIAVINTPTQQRFESLLKKLEVVLDKIERN